MKKRSDRFNTVLNVAENKEQEAAKAIADSQRLLLDYQNQLQELESFRLEYAQRFSEVGSAGIGAARLNDHWRFLQQLDRAIDTQNQAIERMQRILESQRQTWSSHRMRTQAVGGLVDRARDQERRQRERRAQNEIEDLTQQRRRDDR